MTESGRGHSWAKHLYWLSFLAALGVTVGLGWLGAPSLLAPFAAIAVMLGYVMISWVWTRDATRHPDFADGLYYMGFLLTLVALVNTLVRIGSTQGAEGEDVQQFVLTNFGLALATTIVGLLGRTALRMYSDHDAEGAATSAHDRLREASERFRIVLENSAVDMQTTLGSAHSAVDSGVLAIKAHLDAMALRLAEIEKTLQPLGARFETVGQQAADLGSTLGGLGEASGELNEPLHALGRSLEGLEGKLEDARRRLAELADALSATLGVAARVEEVAASLDRSLDPLDRFASSTRALPDVGAQATALASAMADGQSTIEQFIASVRGADAGMQRVAGLPAHLNFEALESLSGTLERQIEGLNVSVRTWQKGVIDLDTLVGQLVQRQRAAAEALLQVQDELKASVHILTTSIEGSPV